MILSQEKPRQIFNGILLTYCKVMWHIEMSKPTTM